jgi:hypothetical protein
MVPRRLKMHNSGCHHARAWWQASATNLCCTHIVTHIALFVDGVGGCVQVMILPYCDGCDTFLTASNLNVYRYRRSGFTDQISFLGTLHHHFLKKAVSATHTLWSSLRKESGGRKCL